MAGIGAAKTAEGSKGKGRAKVQAKPSSSRRKRPRANSDNDESGDFSPVPDRKTKTSKKGRIGRTVGKQYPPDIRKALGIANALYVDHKIPEALMQLQQVVKKCGSIPEPYALLGLIYLDDGKLPNALTFYKLACTRDPRNLQYHQQAARISRELGDHTSRLEILRVLARLQPTDLNVAMEKASCLVELDKPKQALDAYAKAAKRFPRKLDIYLELAERVECTSPPQHIFVHQALASCLRRAMGKRYMGPDVRDLADVFATKLKEFKLEGPKPKRLLPRSRGLPSRRIYECATKATDLLVIKLMESRKRQEPQYEIAVQVVEGLVSWLAACRSMAARIAAGGREDDEEEGDAEEVDSDSDLRDSDDEGSNGEEQSDSDGDESIAEDDNSDDDDEQDGPMDRFVVEHTTLLRYGVCQLYCGEKQKAAQAFAFLRNEDADGEYGDMMLEIAKVYAETDNPAESVVFLRLVAESVHPQHRLAGVQLGAAYALQGKYQPAADAYSVVLAERPLHAAALAGLAEATYWRGMSAAPKALLSLTPAIEKFAGLWAGEQPQPLAEDDDEGEEAFGFHRLQLLLQWATLNRMAGDAANFASVALPLVNVGLGQMSQGLKVERRQTAGSSPPSIGRESGSRADREGQELGRDQQGRGAGGVFWREGEGASGNDGRGGLQVGRLTFGPVPLLLPARKWQSGLPAKVSALTILLSESMDVIDQVGRRAVFWHVVELIRALRELDFPEDAEVVASAALGQAGFLRSVEREDLQIVGAEDNLLILRSMPDGCPILGPASRRPVLSGPVDPADLPSEDAEEMSHSSVPEQFFAPPWRYVEDQLDGGVPRQPGSNWRSSSRPSHAGPRRSRSRALKELAARKNEGDAICTIVLALSRTPGNNAMWNLLQRVSMENGVDAGDGGFHGEQVEALVGRHRERAQGLLYRAHDACVWNRTKPALKLYAQAYAARPQEPLTLLCLSSHILRMITTMETMVERDGVCVLQALACLHRYADLRKPQSRAATSGTDGSNNIGSSEAASRSIPEAVLEQEIWYNLGRGYHQVGLAELAMEYYNRALRVEDQRGEELRNWHGGGGVTVETAHNLIALFKRSGSTAMALGIMQKYLSVG